MSGEQVANSRLNQDSKIMQDTTIRSKKVDINVLLSKVRAEKKKEKFENIKELINLVKIEDD